MGAGTAPSQALGPHVLCLSQGCPRSAAASPCSPPQAPSPPQPWLTGHTCRRSPRSARLTSQTAPAPARCLQLAAGTEQSSGNGRAVPQPLQEQSSSHPTDVPGSPAPRPGRGRRCPRRSCTLSTSLQRKQQGALSSAPTAAAGLPPPGLQEFSARPPLRARSWRGGRLAVPPLAGTASPASCKHRLLCWVTTSQGPAASGFLRCHSRG